MQKKSMFGATGMQDSFRKASSGKRMVNICFVYATVAQGNCLPAGQTSPRMLHLQIMRGDCQNASIFPQLFP